MDNNTNSNSTTDTNSSTVETKKELFIESVQFWKAAAIIGWLLALLKQYDFI